MSNNLVTLFLTRAANSPERKFWISRAWESLQQADLWTPATIKLPNRVEDTPQLEYVAWYWVTETSFNRSPTEEEVRIGFASYGEGETNHE